MPYHDSYIYKIRQKIGHDLLVMPCIEVAALRDNKVLMVYNRDFASWAMPAGYLEDEGAQWREAAARELWEEAGLKADPHDLQPFAIGSGLQLHYSSGDRTQAYTIAFVVEKFTEETDELDEAEVSQKQWFTLEEAEKLPLAPATKMFLPALKQWLRVHTLQIVEIDQDEKINLG